MPTYEFKCPNGHVFDKFFPKISNREHLRCPTCGKQAQRQISAGAGLVFKGSGFYITDYKRAGEKHADSESKVEKSAKADKAEQKAEKADKAPKPDGPAKQTPPSSDK